MKELIKQIYKALYKEDLIQVLIETIPCPVIVPPPLTPSERLVVLSEGYFNTDPTPKDEQPDDVACVHSLTTIIKKLYSDFPIMTYTPVLLNFLQIDKRFKATTEWKSGTIIVSVTGTGNGSVLGHCGIIHKEGKIYSNASSSGLWDNKYDTLSWIERYSRGGKLKLYLFELVE
jgi:hypothetical protein